MPLEQGDKHESKTSIYRPHDGQRLFRKRIRVGRRKIYPTKHGYALELLFAGLGNAGGNVIGLFLVLCLGAAIAIVVGWLFVQILLWAEE